MNSAEIKLTWGENYLGYRAGGNADLDPKGMWNAALAFNKIQITDPVAPGWNDLYFLELNYFANESLSFSGNISYSSDSNGVTSAGPGFSLFYTHFAPDESKAPLKLPGKSRVDMPLPSDVFTLGLDSLVLFYQSEVETIVDPADGDSTVSQKINLTQFSPTLFLDVALIPNRLNLNASGSYFFYSDDPSQIAALGSPSLTPSAIAALDSLLAGLLWSSWNAGACLTLPFTPQLSGNYGRQKQVYTEEWIDSYSLNLSGKISSFLKARIAWRRFSSSAGNSDLYSAALRFNF